MDPRLRRRDPAARDPPARAQFGVELEKKRGNAQTFPKEYEKGAASI